MNKHDLVEQYTTSITKLNEVLRALAIDVDTAEFSPEQVARLDQIWRLVRQEGKTYQEAISIVTNQPIDSSVIPQEITALDPKVTNLLQEKSTTFAEHILEQSPDLLKEQRAVARKIIVDSFWKRINELGRSPEFQRKFDAALYGEESLDVSVLPGESSALPENSSFDT